MVVEGRSTMITMTGPGIGMLIVALCALAAIAIREGSQH